MHAPKIEEVPSSSSDDEWEVVPRQRGWRMHAHTVKNLKVGDVMKDSVSLETLDDCFGRVNTLKEQLSEILEQEGFWERYGVKFESARKLRAYGIGSFSESKSSLFQFCFLLILAERYKLGKDTEFYEPQLCSLDVAVLERFSFSINPDPIKSCEHVLCFMPHCDKVLYQEVIHDLLKERTEFTLISNFLTFYGIHDDSWSRVNECLVEEPIFIWRKDHERFSKIAHHKETLRFKPKSARSSDKIPFEAFNDLAIISVATHNPKGLNEVMKEISSRWSHFNI